MSHITNSTIAQGWGWMDGWMDDGLGWAGLSSSIGQSEGRSWIRNKKPKTRGGGRRRGRGGLQRGLVGFAYLRTYICMYVGVCTK